MNDSQVRAVELLAQEYDYGWGSLHAHKVVDLAASLCDQLRELGLLPGVSDDDLRTLKAAGYAHDIGASARATLEAASMPGWIKAFTSTERHGELAFYLLRQRMATASSNHPIVTLSPGDRSLLLYSLLWHAAPEEYVLDIEPVFDLAKTQLLAGMLRIADGLDCEHRLRVRSIRLQNASAWIRILVQSPTSADEETARAREKSDVLSRALGRRLFVQQIMGQ